MAVIAAGELNDLVPSCGGARQSQGAHGRFRTGVDQANLVHTRHGGDDQFCKPGFGEGRSPEAGALLHRFGCASNNFRICMAENERSPAQHVIDVGIAIDIRHLAAGARFKEDRRSANGSKCAHRRINSTGDEITCVIECSARLGKVEWHVNS